MEIDTRLACLYHHPYMSVGDCKVKSVNGGEKVVVGNRVGKFLFVHRDIGVTYTVRDFETGERITVGGVPFGLLEKTQALLAAKAVDYFLTEGACLGQAAQLATSVWWQITKEAWDWKEFSQMFREGFRECQLNQLDWRVWLEEVWGKK